MYDGIWGKEDPRLKVIAGKTALFLLKRYYNLGQIIIFLLAVASSRDYDEEELDYWIGARLWPIFLYYYIINPKITPSSRWEWAVKNTA